MTSQKDTILHGLRVALATTDIIHCLVTQLWCSGRWRPVSGCRGRCCCWQPPAKLAAAAALSHWQDRPTGDGLTQAGIDAAVVRWSSFSRRGRRSRRHVAASLLVTADSSRVIDDHQLGGHRR